MLETIYLWVALGFILHDEGPDLCFKFVAAVIGAFACAGRALASRRN